LAESVVNLICIIRDDVIHYGLSSASSYKQLCEDFIESAIFSLSGRLGFTVLQVSALPIASTQPPVSNPSKLGRAMDEATYDTGNNGSIHKARSRYPGEFYGLSNNCYCISLTHFIIELTTAIETRFEVTSVKDKIAQLSTELSRLQLQISDGASTSSLNSDLIEDEVRTLRHSSSRSHCVQLVTFKLGEIRLLRETRKVVVKREVIATDYIASLGNMSVTHMVRVYNQPLASQVRLPNVYVEDAMHSPHFPATGGYCFGSLATPVCILTLLASRI
jgi:hypothetical protein